MKAAYRKGVEVVGFESRSRNWRASKKLPTVTITQEALMAALGIDAPIVKAHVSNGRVTFSVLPKELCPSCKECGLKYFPSHAAKTCCSRNCARRARYRTRPQVTA